jgi:hypothetical protein
MITLKAVLQYLNILVFAPRFSIVAWSSMIAFYAIWELGHKAIATAVLLGGIALSACIWKMILKNWRKEHDDA